MKETLEPVEDGDRARRVPVGETWWSNSLLDLWLCVARGRRHPLVRVAMMRRRRLDHGFG